MLPVEAPFKTYTGKDGKPLNDGYVYFGLPDQNPITSPVEVFWDIDGTIPAAQPIRTVNGYVMRAGTPANVFTADAYSELVQDSKRRQVFYARNSDDFSISAILAGLSNFAVATGASLIGFIQAGVGAIARTVQSKLREQVTPEDFGAKGNGSNDDSVAFQAAIDSFSTASAGRIVLTAGKTYRINFGISTNNRNLVIEGNNAIILIGANMTYGLSIISTNCEIRNVSINLASGVTVTAGIYMTGLQHVLRNVSSRSQKWPLFILAQDLKESHFSEIRVDNDPATFTGTIFQFDYCVNNTMSDSMLGFCSQAIYGSSIGQPTFGYHTEGLMISNVIIVYANKAVNIDNGTYIAIVNCCFDFIEAIGIFLSNGNTLNVMNSWIASNLTNNFIGIGSGPNVSNVTVQGNTLVRGASPITGTSGLSLPGLSAVVSGNGFQGGMNGGVVTQPTSQVYGNTIAAPGTTIGALSTTTGVGGTLYVGKDLIVIGDMTVGAITSNNNKGIFPTGLSGVATAGANGAPPAQVVGYFNVFVAGATYKIPYYNV